MKIIKKHSRYNVWTMFVFCLYLFIYSFRFFLFIFCQGFIFIRYRSEILIYVGDNLKINSAYFFSLYSFVFVCFMFILYVLRIK